MKPFQKSSALVTDGVFRWSRNPMYLGMILIVSGIAILEGSVTPWIVVAALAVLLDRVFILREEKMLEETFGAANISSASEDGCEPTSDTHCAHGRYEPEASGQITC